MNDQSSSGKKVVLVVMDGLRPDLINPITMPNLAKYAQENEFFRNARSVFPSMTRVASSSISTGAMPSAHGMMGNAFYFPQFAKDQIFDSAQLDRIRHIEGQLGHDLINIPTFCDVAADANKTVSIVHLGSAGACYCLNPRARQNQQWVFSIHGRDACPVPEIADQVEQRFGPLPKTAVPQYEQCRYGTEVFVDLVLKQQQPDLSILWLNEPDTSFHYKTLKSTETDDMLRHVDKCFGDIIEVFEHDPAYEDAILIIASDHGHVTIEKEIDFIELLKAEGHNILSDRPNDLGNQIAMTAWAMGGITAIDGDVKRVEKINQWLQEQSFIGTVFSKNKNGVEGILPGTLSFNLIGVEHARQPDLYYTLSSTTQTDQYGFAGITTVATGGTVPVGGGMHGGLNPHELNSTLILCGAGKLDDVTRSCGIIDIAPTILDIMGLKAPKTMQGVSLISPQAEAQIEQYQVGNGNFTQAIKVAEDGKRRYLQGVYS